MTTLIGTNPDQIPINSMLGGMAYQDPDSINVKDFNSSGTANIASLVSPAASITNLSYSGTLTGGTGVINIGSGQIYKSAGGFVSLGTTSNPNNRPLFVNGAIGISANGTTEAGKWYSDGTLAYLDSGATPQTFYAGGAERLRITLTGDLISSGTGATKLQEGTTAQRPASPQEGMIRKNSTLGVIEGYSGGVYVSLEAGRLIARTRFTSNGTFIPNAKTTQLIVELVSGGGGSGGVGTTGAGQVAVSSPGDPGRYVKAHLPRGSTLAASYTVTVGTGGAAGTAGVNAGGVGGTSIIDGGGQRVTVPASSVGGAGGSATSSFPVIKTSALAFTVPSTLGAFEIWESKQISGARTIVHDSVDKAFIVESGSPFASDNTRGYGGSSRINWASGGVNLAGFAGEAGEVIIYEYS